MKYRTNILKATSLASLVALCSIGCSSDDPVSSDDPSGASFSAVINEGGDFPTVAEAEDTLSQETTTETVGNEQYFCTETTVSATEAPAEFPNYDPNADVIFPGNLLQGATLGDATPTEIPVKRAGGTIVMTLLNGSGSVSRDIPVVDLGNVFNAQNEIIQNASNTIPARFSFDLEQVSSKEQLALALDLNVSSLSGDLETSMRFSTDREYNRFVVKLRQSYFTMAYQLPTSIDEIFDPSVTPAQLSPYIYDGNPGAFIKSVTYGRVFYLLIESTDTKTDMQASLDASFRAAVASVDLEGGARYVKNLSNLKISAFALGGDQASAIRAITTDFDSLKTFLADGAAIDNGVPLSYKVNSLSNPAKTVSVKVATEYTIRDCVPVGQSADNPIFWFRADDSRYYETGTGSSANRVKKLKNAFNDPALDATPVSSTYGCELVPNAIVSGSGNAAAFRFRSGVSGVDGQFKYAGLDFTNTDYTVVAVVKLENTSVNYPVHFLWGNGTVTGSNLQIGFRDNARATMSHYNYKLDATSTSPVNQFNVIVFRFSQTEGMSIWVNGNSVAAGVDAGKTSILNSYLGARVGSENGAPILIAEIQAFGEAISDPLREVLVGNLLTKYAL